MSTSLLEVVPELELGIELGIVPADSSAGIYTITHRASGRCYVGQSVNILRRWGVHRAALRHNKHLSKYLQRVWAKYGEDAFDFQLVENCEPDDLTEREQFWMDELLPVFNTAPAAGSNRGIKFSAEHRAKIGEANTKRVYTEETKAKLSAAAKGKKYCLGLKRSDETKAKISAARMGNKNWIGRKHSPESIAKMSAAKMGRKLSPEHRAKISAANTGKEGTMTGRKHTDETKAKMSESHRRRNLDKKMTEIAAA